MSKVTEKLEAVIVELEDERDAIDEVIHSLQAILEKQQGRAVRSKPKEFDTIVAVAKKARKMGRKPKYKHCTAPGCFAPHCARSYCHMHYGLWYNINRRKKYTDDMLNAAIAANIPIDEA